jgi:hypothetical protein
MLKTVHLELLVGLSGLLGLLAAPAVLSFADEPRDISAYVGRDVCKMGEDERRQFITLFRSISRDAKALRAFGEDKNWEFVPQALYEFTEPSFRFFVEIAPGYSRPGFCGLRIHVFDDTWKYVRADAFSAGYRQTIRDVYQHRAKEIESDTLVIKSIFSWTAGVIDGDKVIPQLQFYAVVDGSLMLVRREDEQGRVMLNDYSIWSVPEIGMRYPKGTTEELLDILQSGSDPKRLALLAWVAGHHLRSDEKRFDGVSQEPVESSRAHEQLVGAHRFDKIVRDLCASENKWIREYATQVRIGEQR